MNNKLNEAYWFKSPLFKVEAEEDKNTNPFCYGRELANWIRCKLNDLGYSIEEVIEEDWGFCVMCQREPYSLWVGCGNMRSDFYEKVNPADHEGFIPDPDDLVWYCFPTADIPFLKRFFGKVASTDGLEKLNSELKIILSNEKEITFVDKP